MPLTLDGLRLWGASESSNATQANIDVTSAPSQSPEDAFIFGLEAIEQQPLSGRVTGIRLSSQSGYPSDPRDALAQWLQEFESLVSPEQGDGWTLSDDERNRDITVVAEGGEWTYNAGAEFEASWTLTLTRGDAVFTSASRSPSTATPTTSATLGGTDLGTVRQKRTKLRMQTDTTPISYGGQDDTVISPKSGVIREWTISGRVAGSQAELRTFDDTIRGYIPRDSELTYQTGLPGTTHDTLADSYESTYNAGSTATLEYGLTLIEGTVF